MNPSLRKFMLTTHISFSVGWFGAVAAFLVIAIFGVTSNDQKIMQSCYIVMELVAVFVIVPSCFASFATGVIQALGTPWGLFKHYWVIVKLILTVIATILLLLHLNPIYTLADLALKKPADLSSSKDLQVQLIADAGAALLLLSVISAISIFKPWVRVNVKNHQRIDWKERNSPLLRRLIIVGVILAILTFILIHLLSAKH